MRTKRRLSESCPTEVDSMLDEQYPHGWDLVGLWAFCVERARKREIAFNAGEDLPGYEHSVRGRDAAFLHVDGIFTADIAAGMCRHQVHMRMLLLITIFFPRARGMEVEDRWLHVPGAVVADRTARNAIAPCGPDCLVFVGMEPARGSA